MNGIEWEFSVGLVPGFIFGYRAYTYETNDCVDYVLYLGIFDFVLTIHQ
jgi:hypothetical protein